MGKRSWLIEKRKEMNLLQKEVAAATGISVQLYSSIETGARRPSPDVAKKVAGYLGFPWTRFYE